MANFIEITTASGKIALAINCITHVEPNSGGKAVVHVLPAINGSIPFVTATETYVALVNRLK